MLRFCSARSGHSYDRLLPLVCFVVFFAILIEKPMILVFPAFSPTPLGEYAEYHVTLIEFFNVLFVWAVGFMSLDAHFKRRNRHIDWRSET